MTIDLLKVEELSLRAARHAGSRIRESLSHENLSVSEKGRDDLVTEVDVWSERYITQAIREEFPEHTVLGEETQEQLAAERGQTLEEISRQGPCWVLDPLDGTANFVSGLPHAAVSIALLIDGVRMFGLLYDAFLQEMFTARKGGGARLNGSPIGIRRGSKLIDAVVLTGFSSNRYKNWEIYREVNNALTDNSHKCRIYGAAALDIAWVAAGRADVFFQYELCCWDLAAATLIAEEAGARVGCVIEPASTSPLFTPSTLVCAPSLYNETLRLIQEADRRGRAAQAAG